MKQLIFIVSIALAAVSCRKEELPVEPYPRGDLFTASVNMTTLYGTQLYYDLETNAVVSSNQKLEWDLAFACDAGSDEIRLNSSRYMRAWKTSATSLSAITDTMGAVWTVDGPSGDTDSLAIENWQDGSVFVFDRGFSPTGVHQGFVKCIFSQTGQVYEVTFAELDGSNPGAATIPRNATRNYVQLSFDNGGAVVAIEPDKESWDLWFTQFTHVYPDGEEYLVVGVLTNPYQTTCAEINDVPFAEVDIDLAMDRGMESRWDIISWDWKDYNFDISAFEIADTITYVVNTSDNRFFKLRFIDFYDQMGNKGVPTFEVKEL